MMGLLCLLVTCLVAAVVLVGVILARIVVKMDDPVQVGMDYGFCEAMRAVLNKLVSMDAELARGADALEDAIPARLDRIVDTWPRIAQSGDIEVPANVYLAGETSRDTIQRLVDEAVEARKVRRAGREA